MTQPKQLASELFFQHEPATIRFVTPDLSRLVKTVQSRMVRKTGMILEMIPPIQSVTILSVGSRFEFKLKLPHQDEFILVAGRITRVLKLAKDPDGLLLTLAGLDFEDLTMEASQKLEAHHLSNRAKCPIERSARIPVRIHVEPSGIDMMSSLTAVDLSMTGMFVAGRARFPVGKTLHLRCRFPFQKDEVTLTGTVVWNGAKPMPEHDGNVGGFGFVFNELQPLARAKLATYYSRYTW